MRVAALDVGTNSIHMVVAQVDSEGHFRVLDRAKEMVRLGRNGLIRGRLTRPAMDAGVKAIAGFRTLGERQGVTRFRAVATSAVREARNGGDFIQRVKDEVGIRVKVIPGREEARLIHLGVAQAIDLRGEPTLIVDIGGGSIELILVVDGQPAAMHSLKLGVARMNDMFLDRDPPTGQSLKRFESHLHQQLDPVLATFEPWRIQRIVATSGTFLSLLSMAAHRLGVHPGRNLHGLQVSAGEISRLRRVLRDANPAERVKMKGMDAKRSDFALAGAIVADRIVKTLRARTVVACTWALREGLLADYIRRHGPGIAEGAKIADVRRRSVARLLRRLGYHGTHHDHVARLCLRLFDQLKQRLGLGDESRELLEYAALLHDVGHIVDRENHYQHSYYMIVNGELFGFTREEIEIIGQVALHHYRKGTPKPTGAEEVTLPPASWRTIRALAAILRLVEGLDRSHYGIVADVKTSWRGKRLTLELRTEGQDAALEMWEAGRRSDLLGRLLDSEVKLRVLRQAQDKVARKR